MEPIYKINPAANYMRNNRQRHGLTKKVIKKTDVVNGAIDNFNLKDLGKKIVAPVKKLSAALDKALPGAAKITSSVGADTRGLITRSPDVAKATINTLAAPATTLIGKTIFKNSSFSNEGAAKNLNTTLKIAGPVAAGAIVGSAIKQAVDTKKALNSVVKPDVSMGPQSLSVKPPTITAGVTPLNNGIQAANSGSGVIETIKAAANKIPISEIKKAQSLVSQGKGLYSDAQKLFNIGATDPSRLPKTAALKEAEQTLGNLPMSGSPGMTIPAIENNKWVIIGAVIAVTIVLILILKK